MAGRVFGLHGSTRSTNSRFGNDGIHRSVLISSFRPHRMTTGSLPPITVEWVRLATPVMSRVPPLWVILLMTWHVSSNTPGWPANLFALGSSIPSFELVSVRMLIHQTALDTIGVVLSAGRLDVLVLTSSLVLSPSLFP